MRCIYLALAGAVLFLACQSASAQICGPVAERTGEVGCWIIASQPVGQLAKAETFGISMFTPPGPRPKQRELLAVPWWSLLENVAADDRVVVSPNVGFARSP